MQNTSPMSVSSEETMSFSLLSFTPETINQTVTLTFTPDSENETIPQSVFTTITYQSVSPNVFSPASTLPSTLPPIQQTPLQRRHVAPSAPCKFPAVATRLCDNFLDCDGIEFLDGLCNNCYDCTNGINRKLFETD